MAHIKYFMRSLYEMGYLIGAVETKLILLDGEYSVYELDMGTFIIQYNLMHI